MLFYLLKLAFRNILKNQRYFLINFSGLTISLIAAILIFQYTFFEYSFDRFHKDYKKIYRISRTSKTDDINVNQVYTCSQLLGPVLNNEYTSIERFVRLHPIYGYATVK
ncbi:MAG: ABC transporter permease, partial [Candidatus Cyclobacteriaceae bacterium M3_2C_046]